MATFFDFLAEAQTVLDSLRINLAALKLPDSRSNSLSFEAGLMGVFLHFDVYVEQVCGCHNVEVNNFVWNVAKDNEHFVTLETSFVRGIRLRPQPLLNLPKSASRTLAIVATELSGYLACGERKEFVVDKGKFVDFGHFVLKRLMSRLTIPTEELWHMLINVDHVFDVIDHTHHGKGVAFMGQNSVARMEDRATSKTLSPSSAIVSKLFDPNSIVPFTQQPFVITTCKEQTAMGQATLDLGQKQSMSEKLKADLLSGAITLVIRFCSDTEAEEWNSFRVNNKCYFSFDSILNTLAPKYEVTREDVWKHLNSKDHFETIESATFGRGLRPISSNEIITKSCNSASMSSETPSSLGLGTSLNSLSRATKTLPKASETPAHTSSVHMSPNVRESSEKLGVDEDVREKTLRAIIETCRNQLASETNSFSVKNKLYFKFGYIVSQSGLGKNKSSSELNQLWNEVNECSQLKCVKEVGPGMGRGIRLVDLEASDQKSSTSSLPSNSQIRPEDILSRAKSICLSLVAKVDNSFEYERQRYLKFNHVLNKGFPNTQHCHSKFIWSLLMNSTDFDTVDIRGPFMGRGLRLKDSVVALGTPCIPNSVKENTEQTFIMSKLKHVIESSSFLNAVPIEVERNENKMMFPIDFIYTKGQHANLNFGSVNALNRFLRNRSKDSDMFVRKENHVNTKSMLTNLVSEQKAFQIIIEVIEAMLKDKVDQEGVSIQDLWLKLQGHSNEMKFRFNCKKVLREFLGREAHLASFKFIRPSTIGLKERSVNTLDSVKTLDTSILDKVSTENHFDVRKKDLLVNSLHQVLNSLSMLYAVPIKVSKKNTLMMFPMRHVIKETQKLEPELKAFSIDSLTQIAMRYDVLMSFPSLVLKEDCVQLESIFNQLQSEEATVTIVTRVLRNMLMKRNGRKDVDLQSLWCSLQGRNDGMKLRFTDKHALKAFISRVQENSGIFKVFGNDLVTLNDVNTPLMCKADNPNSAADVHLENNSLGHQEVNIPTIFVQGSQPTLDDKEDIVDHQCTMDNLGKDDDANHGLLDNEHQEVSIPTIFVNKEDNGDDVAKEKVESEAKSYNSGNIVVQVDPRAPQWLQLSQKLIYGNVMFKQHLDKNLGLAKVKEGVALFAWKDVTHKEQLDVKKVFSTKTAKLNDGFGRYVGLSSTSTNLPFQFVALRIWQGKRGPEAKGQEALEALRLWSKYTEEHGLGPVGGCESWEQLMSECTPLDSGFEGREWSGNDSNFDVLSIRDSEDSDDEQ